MTIADVIKVIDDIFEICQNTPEWEKRDENKHSEAKMLFRKLMINVINSWGYRKSRI